jgi:hypothetical protein
VPPKTTLENHHVGGGEEEAGDEAEEELLSVSPWTFVATARTTTMSRTTTTGSMPCALWSTMIDNAYVQGHSARSCCGTMASRPWRHSCGCGATGPFFAICVGAATSNDDYAAADDDDGSFPFITKQPYWRR